MTETSTENPVKLHLHWLPGRLAVARLGADAAIPEWAADSTAPFASVTRTADELSIIAPEQAVPAAVTAERGFVALRVAGTLDFSEIGILARLTGTLAKAGISVLAVSTYDTDYLLVRIGDRAGVERVLNSVATFE